MNFSKLIVSVLLCSIFVVACGGGGGGGGGSGGSANNTGSSGAPNPDAGASAGWNVNDVGNYFPLNGNAKWTYWESDGTSSELKKTRMIDVRLANVVPSGALTLATFGERSTLDSPSIEQKIQKAENALSTLVQTVPWLNQQEMVTDINFNVKQGTTWESFSKIGLTYPHDVDGDGKNEVADIVQSSSFDGYENIITEAGEFKLAAKITSINKTTIHVSKPPVSSSTSVKIKVRWFAKGVGLVKEVATIYAGTQYAEVTTRELKAYAVGEKDIGFSFPFVLQNDVGTRNSDYEEVLSQPAFVSNGDGYLLATTREAEPYPYDQSISIVRLGRDMSSLGTSTITCSWHCGQPVMVFNANAYFLSYNSDYNVSFQRFEPNGRAIENASVAIADRGPSFAIRRRDPVVASGGQNYFIAYTLSDDTSGADHKPTGIYGAVISTDGKVLKSDILIRPFATMLQSYSVEFGAGVYFLIFSDQNDVKGVRISEAGVVLDGDAISLSAAPDMQIDPRVVFDGANFIAVWRDRRNYQNLPANIFPLITDIYANRVSPQGVLLDGDAVTGAVLLESKATPKQIPSLIRTSRGIFLGWPSGTYTTSIESPGIYLQLLSTTTSPKTVAEYFVSGTPQDNTARIGMFYSGVTLATNSDELIAAWVDNSVPLADKKHKRVIAVRAKLASLPLHTPR